MKKAALFLILQLLFLKVYPNDNKQDSICYDLCLFFVSQKIITEEHMEEFENKYCSLIIIWDVLKKDDYPNMPDLSKNFGVYKFDYVGRETEASFILIKNEDNYKIYHALDYPFIINELLKIREEKNNPIDSDLFDRYLKLLTGFGENKFSISFKVGNLEYIMK